MAKKPEILQQQTEATNTPMSEGNGISVARTRATTKAPRKTKRTTTAARKPQATKKKPSPDLSEDVIRLRAYFISEQRMRLSIPGDANSDWIEARRQLVAELGQPDR